MSLSEDEEFELLSLEREKSLSSQSQNNEPGLMNQIGSAFRNASSVAQNTPMGQIAGMQNTIDTGFKKLGGMAEKSFQNQGLNASPLLSPSKPMSVSPTTSKILGKTIEYAPTVASLFATPLESAGQAVESAVPAARRALGFQKSLLKTPFARGQATKAAETALEKGVIPLSGSPEVMMERASEISTKSGQKLGSILKGIGFDKLAPEAELDMENFRQMMTKGTDKGLFSAANGVIDQVKSTISELYGRGATAQTYNEAKNILGKSLNYLSDLSSQAINKKTVNAMANTIRSVVKRVVPDSYAEFLNNQKLFNASELMKKGLNNEIAGQMGNAAVSLPGAIMGAGELATGNPLKAAATIGLTEGIKRRGAGMTASLLQKTGSNLPSIASTGARVLNPKDLDETTAQQILDEAGGDPDKARKIAKARGFKI